MSTIDDLAKAAVSNQIKEISVAEWGGNDKVNCYAWAANCKSPNSAKPYPGQKSGYDPQINDKFDPQRCITGAERDGMHHLPCKNQSDPPAYSDGHYLVALYISTDGSDHHWYRKDPKYGRWTHKPGPQGIRNFGVGFKVLPTELVMISHDYGSTRTNYKFVAYFEVPEAGISVG